MTEEEMLEATRMAARRMQRPVHSPKVKFIVSAIFSISLCAASSISIAKDHAQCVVMPATFRAETPGPVVTISVHSVSDAGECCDLCGSTPKCVMYVLDKGASPFACYLKSDTNDDKERKVLTGAEMLAEKMNRQKYEQGMLLNGYVKSSLGLAGLRAPGAVVRGEANISRRIAQELLPRMEPLPRDEVITVFLDHGDVTWHAEVFYAVAKMLQRKYLESHNSRVKFVIDSVYARYTKLDSFWDKHVHDLDYQFTNHKGDCVFTNIGSCPGDEDDVTLKANRHPMVSFKESRGMGYRPIVQWGENGPRCNRDAPFGAQKWNRMAARIDMSAVLAYDVRAVITNPKFQHPESKEFKDFTCYSTFKDHERYLFILHYPVPALFPWTNVYAATNSETAKRLTPRHFTPDEMPVSPVPPDCTKPPVFVVQGSIGRRLTDHLVVLAKEDASEIGGEITIRVITRSQLSDIIDTRNPRVDYLQNLGMSAFAEAPLGAAFLLPLISPDHSQTAHYFRGHPTSSVAFAKHYALRIVGRKELVDSYSDDLKCVAGHYHADDTKETYLKTVKEAVADFSDWCASPAEERGTWMRPTGGKGKVSC